MRPGGKKPPSALWLFSGVLFLHWIIAGLDRGRFHWSDTVPLWLQVLGLVAVAGSYAFALWAMSVNRFFSSVVRLQSDRGQYVVTAGPYAVIRHPGYTAGIVIMLASGIALGSWLAAAFLVVTTLPFLLYRAITEDRFLQAELAGLSGLRRTRALAADAGPLVRGGRDLPQIVNVAANLDSHKTYYGIYRIYPSIYGLSATANVIPSNAGTTCTGSLPRKTS